MMETNKFEIGDIVSFGGAEGRIIETHYNDAHPFIRAAFINETGEEEWENFQPNGRYREKMAEPKLEFIKKPDNKLKAYLWLHHSAAFCEPFDNHQVVYLHPKQKVPFGLKRAEWLDEP